MNAKSHFQSEFGIIPSIARVIAVIGFAVVQVVLLIVLPHFEKQVGGLPPRPWLTVIALVGGFFFAGFILLVGYVNADSKRRGMNSLLWTLLVIFLPKAIGFIAYFLLRKPLLIGSPASCPKCGTGVGSDFRFCPKCGHSFAPTCVQCGRSISPDYICCPYCGKPVGATVVA